MANPEKQQRAEKLGDGARFKLDVQLSAVPGSPASMPNNPQNIPGEQLSSLGGGNSSIYGEYVWTNDPRLGGVYAQPNTEIQQANTAGRGYQGNTGRLDNIQMQPPAEAADPFESNRHGEFIKSKYPNNEVNYNGVMFTGLPATATTGALPPTLNVNENTLEFGAPFTGAKGTGMGRGGGRNQIA